MNILKGCRKRKRSSQKELYMMFYNYGLSIAIRYVKNREEALEVFNDSFLKVYVNIDKYNPEMPFKNWLRKIIVNTSINHIKKEGKLQFSTIEEETKQIGIVDSALSGMEYQDLLRMVQELPPAYRTVFNLYVIEGYKHDEIADMLGISTGTSKSNLSKAKDKLRVTLSDYFMNDYDGARKR